MVYDLETVPDVVLGRKLLSSIKKKDELKVEEGSEKEDANALNSSVLPATAGIQQTKAPHEEIEDPETIVQTLIERRRSQTQNQSDFLPHYLQQIVAISVVVSTPDWVKVWSLGEPESTEKELIERFFAGLDRYTPTLVSWNGCGFDLPVLHYRSLLHGVVASKYWEMGDNNPEFRWNNYLNRYHQRHTDLMDVLSGYQRGAPLNEIALMLDLPGKMGMEGGKVWKEYQNGNLQNIRDYCETDVLNTYIIYLRLCLIRGQFTEHQYLNEILRLKENIRSLNKDYLNEFLENWEKASSDKW